MFFPDYQGIEIKCTTRFSRYPISLFSKSFDDPSFFEMNRLINIYEISCTSSVHRMTFVTPVACSPFLRVPACLSEKRAYYDYHSHLRIITYKTGKYQLFFDFFAVFPPKTRPRAPHRDVLQRQRTQSASLSVQNTVIPR